MSEDAFNGVLTMIIDTHREAERNRKLWARIWAILALSITVLVGAGWYSLAHAEPVPAYEGCTLAWDYDESVAHLVESFFFNVDTRPGHTQVGGQARSIPCATLNLTLGNIHLLKVRAHSKSLGYSPFAEITVAYQPKPAMVAPTNIRIQLEWTMEE